MATRSPRPGPLRARYPPAVAVSRRAGSTHAMEVDRTSSQTAPPAHTTAMPVMARRIGVTVRDRDIERLEAENAPPYVPFLSWLTWPFQCA